MDGRVPRRFFGKSFIALFSLGFAATACDSGLDTGAGQVRNNLPPPQGQFDPSGSRFIVKFRTASPFGGSGLWDAPTGRLLTVPTGTVGVVGQTPQSFLVAETGGGGSQVEPIVNRLYLVKISPGQGSSPIENIRNSPDVEYVESDPVVHTFEIPNDPDYPQQWSHQAIQSARAWDITQGSKDVLVAEIDTGVDYNHPDLADNMFTDTDGSHGYNFVANTSDPMADDTHFHGTHVAGIIGAVGNNGIGVVGATQHVRIMALKFMDSSGAGNVSDAIRAIYYAISKGAKIMSNSWGGGSPSQALYEAIDSARQAGILFVAAAGNGNSAGVGQDNDQTPTYPASYQLDNVVAVAATDQSDQLTSFSNFGAKTVHVSAPGSQIYSTMNGSRYQYMSGTSMATPLVSGVAALMLAAKPALGYADLKRILIQSSDPLPGLQGRVVANGRINSYRAVASAAGGTAPVPTPSPSVPPSPAPGPAPTPVPTWTPPGPAPAPVPGNIAPPPLLDGQMQLSSTNPYVQIAIDYDLSAFPGTFGAYLEVSQPGFPFMNPNGNSPDPSRLKFAFIPGVRNQLYLLPIRDLPGWGNYSIRVIPLTAMNQPTGLFSNASELGLAP